MTRVARGRRALSVAGLLHIWGKSGRPASNSAILLSLFCAASWGGILPYPSVVSRLTLFGLSSIPTVPSYLFRGAQESGV